MGTRADFYLGKGEGAEWLGSSAWDGHYQTMEELGIANAATEKAYLEAVNARLSEDDGTRPKDGWPWPWESSHTTAVSYTWADGKVWISHWGRQWQTLDELKAHDRENERRLEAGEDELPDLPKVPFPDMTERKRVTLGKRSGVLIIGS